MKSVSDSNVSSLCFHIVVLLIATSLSALVFALLSYCYYDDARFSAKLAQAYLGAHFEIGRGRGEQLQGKAVLSATDVDGNGFLELTNLDIKASRFSAIEFRFSSVPDAGAMSVGILHYPAQRPWGQHLNVDEQGVARVALTEGLPTESVIYHLAVIQGGLFKRPLVLDKVVFVPARRTVDQFWRELVRGFATQREWRLHSINMHKPVHTSPLINPKVIIVVVSSLAVLIYRLTCIIFRTRMFSTTVLLIMLPWIMIDALYYYEQIATVRNTHRIYGGLSEVEKNQKTSPRSYPIASSILSAMPEEKVNIRIYTGERSGPLVQADHFLRYLDGRLKYYLLPHNTYTRYKSIPVGVLKEGGFYLANISGKPFEFRPQQNSLRFQGVWVKAEQLIDTEHLDLYRLVGGSRDD